MREQLRKRLEGQTEEGFTLIELMVVVLIIAILLAIAIPSFLGARGKAQDRAAQSNVRNALTAEKTYFTDNQSYTDVATALTHAQVHPPATGCEALFATGDRVRQLGQDNRFQVCAARAHRGS